MTTKADLKGSFLTTIIPKSIILKEYIFMKATSSNFLTVIKGPKQFVIPIYQRIYGWQLAQCKKCSVIFFESAGTLSCSVIFRIGTSVMILNQL